jgi:hypothetical protein
MLTGCLGQSGTTSEHSQATPSPSAPEEYFEKFTGESPEKYCLNNGEITDRDTIFIYNRGEDVSWSFTIKPQRKTTPTINVDVPEGYQTPTSTPTDKFNITTLHKQYSGNLDTGDRTIITYLDSEEFEAHRGNVSDNIKYILELEYERSWAKVDEKYDLKNEALIIIIDSGDDRIHRQISCEEWLEHLNGT